MATVGMVSVPRWRVRADLVGIVEGKQMTGTAWTAGAYVQETTGGYMAVCMECAWETQGRDYLESTAQFIADVHNDEHRTMPQHN